MSLRPLSDSLKSVGCSTSIRDQRHKVLSPAFPNHSNGSSCQVADRSTKAAANDHNGTLSAFLPTAKLPDPAGDKAISRAESYSGIVDDVLRDTRSFGDNDCSTSGDVQPASHGATAYTLPPTAGISPTHGLPPACGLSPTFDVSELIHSTLETCSLAPGCVPSCWLVALLDRGQDAA